MARERSITRKTTTVEHLPAEGDPIAGAIRAGLAEYARLDLTGYCGAYWAAVSYYAEARLDVFKKIGGHFNKLGTLRFGEVDAEDMEPHLVTTWRAGIYQLRPIVGNKYYAPASMSFHVGEDEEPSAGSGRGSDLVGVMNSLTEMGLVKQLKELKEGLLGERKGDDEGMKAGEVKEIIASTTGPMIAMMEASERRAAAAEQRNHDLQMKLMEMAGARQQGAQGSIAELIKLLPKEALGALLAPADTPGWAEKAVDALREFGPALAQMLTDYFRPGAGAAPARAALTEGPESAVGAPRPTGAAEGGGGGAVPIQLNPEQQEAKKMLLDCIRERDFGNAFAMVENFPGFTMTPQGPMPIGTAFLGLVDPKVTKPRIYVIHLMQLAPELKDMLDPADAFIAYVQERLMKDQEAFLAQQRRGGTPGDAGGPKPTIRGEEDERA